MPPHPWCVRGAGSLKAVLEVCACSDLFSHTPSVCLSVSAPVFLIGSPICAAASQIPVCSHAARLLCVVDPVHKAAPTTVCVPPPPPPPPLSLHFRRLLLAIHPPIHLSIYPPKPVDSRRPRARRRSCACSNRPIDCISTTRKKKLSLSFLPTGQDGGGPIPAFFPLSEALLPSPGLYIPMRRLMP